MQLAPINLEGGYSRNAGVFDTVLITGEAGSVYFEVINIESEKLRWICWGFHCGQKRANEP